MLKFTNQEKKASEKKAAVEIKQNTNLNYECVCMERLIKKKYLQDGLSCAPLCVYYNYTCPVILNFCIFLSLVYFVFPFASAPLLIVCSAVHIKKNFYIFFYFCMWRK